MDCKAFHLFGPLIENTFFTNIKGVNQDILKCMMKMH